MARVSVRGGFSDRNNIKPEKKDIQFKQLDKRTRIQLQNMISLLYDRIYDAKGYYTENRIQNFFMFVLGDIFSELVDTRKIYNYDVVFSMINSVISSYPYDDVLTLIEAIIQYWDSYLKRTYQEKYYHTFSKEYVYKSVYQFANDTFKKEYVGYRFIDGIIVPISDELEVKTIQESLDNKYNVVREHISKANSHLADRVKPDYENSIKESISAVEALCIVVTNARGSGATLGKMLEKLESLGVVIHPAMRSAFNCLYGYTSDAKGIRHAGNIGGPESTFEEAKYMLVSCCAFVNYITALFSD